MLLEKIADEFAIEQIYKHRNAESESQRAMAGQQDMTSSGVIITGPGVKYR